MSKFDFLAAMADIDVPGIRTALKDHRLDLYTYMQVLQAYEWREGEKAAYPGIATATHKVTVHQRAGANRYTRNVITDPGGAFPTMDALGLRGAAPIPEELLLLGAVALEFDFVLEKQYLSRDDCPFYPIDNPIRKEFVFKVPMIPGSSWKGNLRSAAVENMLAREASADEKREERYALIDIFGDEKGNEDERPADTDDRSLGQFLNEHFGFCPLGRRRGRLRCLPSYFDRIDLDVLNPRDRETRAGTLPIVFEVVPAGATARFGLFYFPFDLLGKENENKLWAETRRDWTFIGEALHQMFRVSGFGAKKSSGCGKAKNDISNWRLDSLAYSGAAKTEFTQLPELHEGFGGAV